MEKKDVIEFYNDFAGERYLTEIRRFGIRYDEMVKTLVDFIKLGRPKTVLDIGCGVGNIDEMVLDGVPDVHITGVDVAPEMLAVAKTRLGQKSQNVELLCQDILTFEPTRKFDLIFSNIAIHNLKIDEKRALLTKIKSWLNNDGVFLWGDFMKWFDPSVEFFCMESRKSAILATGIDENFVENVLKKESEDPRLTVAEEIELLKEAGFNQPDVLWVWSFLSVIRASNK